MTEHPDDGLMRVGSFLARATLGLLPGGGTAAEIFSLVVGDPAANRRNRFLADLLSRIEALERAGHIDLAEMAADERVGATILGAVQIALRSHGQAKLLALRNATLGGTCINANRDLATMVLAIVGDLTELHLYILNEIVAVAARYGRTGSFVDEGTFRHAMLQKVYGTRQSITVGFVKTAKKLPGIPDPESSQFRLILSDLFRTGLLETKVRADEFAGQPRETRSMKVSDLGALALRQIAEGAELAGDTP